MSNDHGPVSPEARETLNFLARLIDGYLNENMGKRKWGFALLMYPFGERPDSNRMNYIGNGEREDVLIAIKELAARWEGRYQKPKAKQ